MAVLAGLLAPGSRRPPRRRLRHRHRSRHRRRRTTSSCWRGASSPTATSRARWPRSSAPRSWTQIGRSARRARRALRPAESGDRRRAMPPNGPFAIDKDSIEAHRILALVYSAWSEGAPASARPTRPSRARASHRTLRGDSPDARDGDRSQPADRLRASAAAAGEADEAVTVLEAGRAGPVSWPSPMCCSPRPGRQGGQMQEAGRWRRRPPRSTRRITSRL